MFRNWIECRVWLFLPNTISKIFSTVADPVLDQRKMVQKVAYIPIEMVR